MKGEFCPYTERPLLCQEEAGCLECQVYYDTMPLPYDGKTVKEVEDGTYTQNNPARI